jgi:hypothetical protein
VSGIGVYPFTDLGAAPVVSRHDYPQVSPQEWDCGCVTAAWITDRDALEGERPFEMRLVSACGQPNCCVDWEEEE